MTRTYPAATGRAADGIRWLTRRLGERYQGWVERAGVVVVELLDEGQVSREFAGKTLEVAVDQAARFVLEEGRRAA